MKAEYRPVIDGKCRYCLKTIEKRFTICRDCMTPTIIKKNFVEDKVQAVDL